MSLAGHFRLMARYNALMNTRLYDAAARLPPGAVARDQGAFFGSVLGTLSHLAITDTLWLQRCGALPSLAAAVAPLREVPRPPSLDWQPCPDLASLRSLRERIDAAILEAMAVVDEPLLQQPVPYTNMAGEHACQPLAGLLAQLFNHQTHHRGQATTLLTQMGQDVGSTDVIRLVPAVAAD